MRFAPMPPLSVRVLHRSLAAEERAHAIGRAYGAFRRALDDDTDPRDRAVVLQVALESLLRNLTRNPRAEYTRAETLHAERPRP